MPRPNMNSDGDDFRQYHLCPDAFKTGVGGLLFQLRKTEAGTSINKELWDQLSIVMFISYQFIPTQSRYHTTEKNALL